MKFWCSFKLNNNARNKKLKRNHESLPVLVEKFTWNPVCYSALITLVFLFLLHLNNNVWSYKLNIPDSLLQITCLLKFHTQYFLFYAVTRVKVWQNNGHNLSCWAPVSHPSIHDFRNAHSDLHKQSFQSDVGVYRAQRLLYWLQLVITHEVLTCPQIVY